MSADLLTGETLRDLYKSTPRGEDPETFWAAYADAVSRLRAGPVVSAEDVETLRVCIGHFKTQALLRVRHKENSVRAAALSRILAALSPEGA